MSSFSRFHSPGDRADGRSSRHHLSARSLIQIAFGILAIVFLAWVVVSNWRSVVNSLSRMNPLLVTASLLLAFAGTVLAMLSWHAILRSFGHSFSLRDAGRITFTVQIGKYIPGGIWPMVAGSQAGGQLGISGTTMVVSMTLQLIISLLTGSVMALGTLFLVPVLAERYWWLIVFVLAAGCVLLTPVLLRRILALVSRILRRRDMLAAVGGRHLGLAVVWGLASWIAFGLHLWLLFTAVDGPHLDRLIPALSGYALSWVVGFLAIFAPAGTGVREGILVLLFSASLGATTILGVALVSRILLVVVDFTLFSLAQLDRARVRRARVTISPGGGS